MADIVCWFIGHTPPRVFQRGEITVFVCESCGAEVLPRYPLPDSRK